jgi:hypothetical protein
MTDTTTAAAPTPSQLATTAAADARAEARAKILAAADQLAHRVLGDTAAGQLTWSVNADRGGASGEYAAYADLDHQAATLLYYDPPANVVGGQGRLELMLYCHTCHDLDQHPVRSLPELGHHLTAAPLTGGAR